MSIDVSDATFQAEVIDRSATQPVVVDVWAPWCGPCRTLGPIIEGAVAATDGQVVLAKVNADENPGISQAFRVQGIPAVFGIRDGKVVDGFVGARGEEEVTAFVRRLLPSEEEEQLAALVAAGDEASLRQALDLDPGHVPAVLALAELAVEDGRGEEALELLARIPETAENRRLAAAARAGGEADGTDVEAQLGELLERVKDDDEARQRFVDLLELLGPDDPRTATWRKALTSRLF